MPSCLRQLGDASRPDLLDATFDLRSYLATVPDPRARRGIRHPWTALLTAVSAAVLAGAASITAIGEWVADAPQRVLAQLGFRPDPLTGRIRPPHATTIRLVLAAADGDALDRAISAFLTERKTPVPGRKVIAVDGTTLRGSRTAGRTATALIAAMTHSGQVLKYARPPIPRPFESGHGRTGTTSRCAGASPRLSDRHGKRRTEAAEKGREHNNCPGLRPGNAAVGGRSPRRGIGSGDRTPRCPGTDVNRPR
ncbi:hypothetical protein GCM10010358_79530 [Streptomyces minutiscleroticus]|uniref:H repeat-associated protein N-terminal domain-containing protein n=1 Tax=Streptomyces minutiscleroticus TaxID=68238 RepID=A0A918UAA4_9ACTN|nr:hypothetical protein GCM10010358_79530 [Streptomyces minutiscleroticus]